MYLPGFTWIRSLAPSPGRDNDGYIIMCLHLSVRGILVSAELRSGTYRCQQCHHMAPAMQLAERVSGLTSQTEVV